jgi:phage tail-like protein
MADRVAPYGAFNFLVDLKGPIGPEEPLGGFSDVSGINLEITISEYRSGRDKENYVRKIPGIHKVGDVTLKRGVVNSKDLWDWMDLTRRTGVAAKRDVVITLRNEVGAPVESWTLRGVSPMKYTGPTLAAKGGGEVAIEELVLSAEGIDFATAG